MRTSSRLARLTQSLVLSSAVLTLATAAQADEPRYNQVSLRAEVSHEIAHDLMQVTLYSEAQDADPAALGAQITRNLNKALEQARKAEGVKVALGSRNSYPLYDEKRQKITGWRERGEVRLESADFAALSKLSGEMLQNMSMGNMSFSIADKTRKAEEDKLIKEAVDAFKARAQLATEALGGSGYKLVSLNLNTSGFQPPMMMRAKGAMMMDSAPTPEIKGGSSQVTVNADGAIEVQMP